MISGEKNSMRFINDESGVAIILALIMLLVMSVIAVAISFMANIDYKMMQNQKRGQEAFLAAETCTREGRRKFEVLGIETLYFELQGLDQFSPDPFDPNATFDSNNLDILLPITDDPNTMPSTWKGPVCRSGPRNYDSATEGLPKIVSIPPPSKTTGRPLKNISLASGGSGGAVLVPVTFRIVGKDSQDKDKFDQDDSINTGKEIAVGLENFIPGGASNRYD